MPTFSREIKGCRRVMIRFPEPPQGIVDDVVEPSVAFPQFEYRKFPDIQIVQGEEK